MVVLASQDGQLSQEVQTIDELLLVVVLGGLGIQGLSQFLGDSPGEVLDTSLASLVIQVHRAVLSLQQTRLQLDVVVLVHQGLLAGKDGLELVPSELFHSCVIDVH